MSYTTLYGFTANDRVEIAEFRNSHGFAPMIWRALLERYYPGHPTYEPTPLWENPCARFEPWERVVLQSTYDRALIHATDVHIWTNCLRQFYARYVASERVSHLNNIASKALEAAESNSSIVAFGFYVTSLSENLWTVRMPESFEEYEDRPYDLSQDTGHWFIDISQAETNSSKSSNGSTVLDEALARAKAAENWGPGWEDQRVLAAEVLRFREREPLIQALLEEIARTKFGSGWESFLELNKSARIVEEYQRTTRILQDDAFRLGAEVIRLREDLEAERAKNALLGASLNKAYPEKNADAVKQETHAEAVRMLQLAKVELNTIRSASDAVVAAGLDWIAMPAQPLRITPALHDAIVALAALRDDV